MNKSSTAVAALVAAAIGLAFVPSAFAEQQGDPQAYAAGLKHHVRGEGQMRGGLLDLVCSERGAEQLEIAFVRITHRITLTAEQQTLFDDLRGTALAAQTSFAATCATARGPVADTVERPGLVERLQTRIVVQTAEVQAWTAVLPKLEAFIGGLTDEQKAALEPTRDHQGFVDDREDSPGGPNGLQHPGGPDVAHKPGNI